MGYRAHIAKKYDVQYGTAFYADEFESNLRQLQDIPEYEDIVFWNSDSCDEYELCKELLMNAKDDSKLTKELRSFVEEILESCDPALEFVRVDFF